MSLPLFAQNGTTTTYNVTGTTYGTFAYPWRFFNMPFLGGGQIQWLEVGQNTGCSGQTQPPEGFIFIDLPTGVNLPCAPLVNGPGPASGQFQGRDANGIPFSGNYKLIMTTYACGYRYTKTCYKITGGTLTLAY